MCRLDGRRERKRKDRAETRFTCLKSCTGWKGAPHLNLFTSSHCVHYKSPPIPAAPSATTNFYTGQIFSVELVANPPTAQQLLHKLNDMDDVLRAVLLRSDNLLLQPPPRPEDIAPTPKSESRFAPRPRAPMQRQNAPFRPRDSGPPPTTISPTITSIMPNKSTAMSVDDDDEVGALIPTISPTVDVVTPRRISANVVGAPFRSDFRGRGSFQKPIRPQGATSGAAASAAPVVKAPASPDSKPSS